MEFVDEFGFDVSSLKTYSGYYLNSDILKKSASGGIATAISEGFINDGGIVFGVKYSEDFKSAEFCMVNNIKDLTLLRGTKYIAPRKEVYIDNQYYSVYKLTAEKLALGMKVLFIGLGCDIAAVKKTCESQNISTDNLFTIDLICHGPTTQDVAAQFIDTLEKQYKSKVIDFNVRYKKEGWVPIFLRAVFESGQIYEKLFYETDYGRAFAIFPREGCFSCKFRGVNHCSDLSIGDYWGMDKIEPEYNKYGVSVAFVNNCSKGMELLNLINQATFHLQETDTIRALRGNMNYCFPREKSEKYDSFKLNFKRKGLHYAAAHTVPSTQRFKLNVKKLVKKMLPFSIFKTKSKHH